MNHIVPQQTRVTWVNVYSARDFIEGNSVQDQTKVLLKTQKKQESEGKDLD